MSYNLRLIALVSFYIDCSSRCFVLMEVRESHTRCWQQFRISLERLLAISALRWLWYGMWIMLRKPVTVTIIASKAALPLFARIFQQDNFLFPCHYRLASGDYTGMLYLTILTRWNSHCMTLRFSVGNSFNCIHCFYHSCLQIFPLCFVWILPDSKVRVARIISLFSN